MKRLASHLLVLLFAMQAVVLFAQEHEKIQPGFTLSIAELPRRRQTQCENSGGFERPTIIHGYRSR